MILTDKEILDIWEVTYVQRGDTGIEFARGVIAAYEAKLNSAEPVGYFDQEYMGGPVLIYQVNYSHKDKEGVFPLYLHPPAPSAVEGLLELLDEVQKADTALSLGNTTVALCKIRTAWAAASMLKSHVKNKTMLTAARSE